VVAVPMLVGSNPTEGGGFFQRKEPPPGRPKGTVKAVWQKTGMAIKKKKKTKQISVVESKSQLNL
jgi:hypothetical protein